MLRTKLIMLVVGMTVGLVGCDEIGVKAAPVAPAKPEPEMILVRKSEWDALKALQIGRYQVNHQGDTEILFDTATGNSCVKRATPEYWKKFGTKDACD